MAVTITPTANSALDTDLTLTGSVAISGALADSTEILNVSIYYTNNGATFIGVPQTYNGTNTATTYNFANGTVMTVNQSTGAWSFQRLTSEMNSEEYEYTITFTITKGTSTSGSVTVKPTANITITEFSANSADDLDDTITGVCNVSITDVTNQKITANIISNSDLLEATPQVITSATGTYTFTYSDSTTLVVNLGSKTWTYTRKLADIGNKGQDTYSFILVVGNKNSEVYVSPYVGYAPTVTKFSIDEALDTVSKIEGIFLAENIINTSVKVDVKHDDTIMEGTAKTYTANSTVTWAYSDTTTFSVNTATGKWEYNRLQADTEDLREDEYEFTISITSRYGSDSISGKVATTIPSATILGFSADGVADTEPYIDGVLSFTLPAVAEEPTMQIDVTINGVSYTGIPVDISSATETRFTYRDGSRLDVDITEGTFRYTRPSDDVEVIATDSYDFKCTIIANRQTTIKTLTVKTYASIRNYDYQPAYPVLFYAGSPEAENTAWPKYIEEIKRVYRLYNENMNYYESLTNGVFERIDNLEKNMAANMVGIILPYSGDVAKIPTGWALCDGQNGTPDLRDRFLQGSDGTDVGEFVEAGLPNITGQFGPITMVGSVADGSFSYESKPRLGLSSPLSNHMELIKFNAESGRKQWHENTYETTPIDTIYGNSQTVQPSAYKVCYIMKVAES